MAAPVSTFLKNLPILFGITVVTVLIWTWATGATRTSREQQVTIRFEVDDPAGGTWRVDPPSIVTRVEAEGSRVALNQVDRLTSSITITLEATEGTQDLALARRVNETAAFREAGLVVTGATPNVVQLEKIRRVRLPVERVTIRGLSTGGSVRTFADADGLQPDTERWIWMDAADRDRILQDRLTLEARPTGSSDWPALKSGETVSIQRVSYEVEDMPWLDNLTLEPPELHVSFTVEEDTSIFEATNVRIHVMFGPDEDLRVVLDPPRFDRVRITGSAEVLDKLRRPDGSLMLVGILHLRSTELARTESTKQLAGFVVMEDLGSGGAVAFTPVTGEVYGDASSGDPVSGLPTVTYRIVKPESAVDGDPESN